MACHKMATPTGAAFFAARPAKEVKEELYAQNQAEQSLQSKSGPDVTMVMTRKSKEKKASWDLGDERRGRSRQQSGLPGGQTASSRWGESAAPILGRNSSRYPERGKQNLPPIRLTEPFYP